MIALVRLVVILLLMAAPVAAQSWYGIQRRPLYRILTVNTTAASTAADTNETNLWTYTLPGGTLGRDGQLLRIALRWSTAANANTKRGRLYFGATAVLDSGAVAFNGQNLITTAYVIRTGATTQTAFSQVLSTANQLGSGSAPTETLANDITVRFSCQNGTAAAADCTFNGVVVEAVN